MRIKFTGYMDIAPEDEPDDRGSIDHWIANLLDPLGDFSTDDTFKHFNLTWEVVCDAGNTNS